MNPTERERFSRQIRFAEFGEAGQESLLSATVAVVGCGALGSFQAGALARAGVGRLVLVDRDYVELSNLQRQWLYDEADARDATPKAVAAARHISQVASGCHVIPRVEDLNPANAGDLLGGVDLILDGTDNFETRYLVNDFAVQHGIPWVYGAAVASYGLTMPIIPDRTACLACVYPAAPQGTQDTCETVGVLGPLTSVIASLQAAAAMKILCGQEVSPWITTVDVWSGTIRQIRQPERDPDCRACARRQFEHLHATRRAPVKLCGRNAVQIHDSVRRVNLTSLGAQLQPLGQVRVNEFALRFAIPPYDITVFPDGRAIIRGTEDPGIARSLYARYIGA
jgi:adenylyltransferase/sulfurtransferase